MFSTGWQQFGGGKRMAALGIRPGDELAAADFASYSYFARLAGARFSMQMLTEDLAVPPKLPKAEMSESFPSRKFRL